MNCPRCGAAITGLNARGPDAHVFDPCGCPTGFATARELAEPRIATDGGRSRSPEAYPVSVRVAVADREVTWHTSDTAYERLHNHPDGNLVDEIETEARARDGSLFDAVVTASGSVRMTEVDA